MKRTLVLLIALIVSLSLTACSKANGATPAPEGNHTEAPSTESPDKMLQETDLVGPWHLDSDKNDLAAFAGSLDLFPGYSEWGASMEIRSDGQMSWYIGAAGGYGTYTADDGLLHAALVNNMDQAEMAIDFRIVLENEKTVLEMDYEDITVYWAYGDQEEEPAFGTDGSLGDAVYPGADVVEIVNQRGDETTIYKLADGTYMDRIDRRFIYDGADVWTDENGVEWNEAAKD